MAEERDDYAVAAAREWMLVRFDHGTEHINSCQVCQSDLAKLAAIIRKHTNDEIDRRLTVEASGNEPCDHTTIDCEH